LREVELVRIVCLTLELIMFSFVDIDNLCPEKTKFWGLFIYKAQWSLNLQGWLALGVILAVIIWIIAVNIHPFLALKKPIEAEVLLVEGWVNDDVVKGSLAEFERGNYKIIITTGSPLAKGHFLSQYRDFAELTKASLIFLGVDPEKIIAIPCPEVAINRTEAAALAIREWLLNSSESYKNINLYSHDVHTRRSWLIYRQILQPEFKIGAIAYPNNYYDPKSWWTSSGGVRTILPEAIAYLYFKVFG
jgi:hypothetical protein